MNLRDYDCLTFKQVSERLTYDPETGLLRWRASRYTKAGRIAGYRDKNYIQVRICRRLVLGHRLAWLLMTGEFPPAGMLMDHINRDKHDNRWSNLRIVDDTGNVLNRDLGPECGVCYCRQTGKWKAYLGKEYRQKWLGRFETKSDAIAARLAAEAIYRDAPTPRAIA